MKFIRSILEICFILFLSALCISTNPTRAQYTNWVSQYYLQDLSEEAHPAANLLKEIGTSAMLNYSTTAKDYLFFSVFSSQIGDTTLRCIGILDHFIPLSFSPRD